MPPKIPGLHIYRPEHRKNQDNNPASKPTLRIFGTDIHLGRAPRLPAATASNRPRLNSTPALPPIDPAIVTSPQPVEVNDRWADETAALEKAKALKVRAKSIKRLPQDARTTEFTSICGELREVPARFGQEILKKLAFPRITDLPALDQAKAFGLVLELARDAYPDSRRWVLRSLGSTIERQALREEVDDQTLVHEIGALVDATLQCVSIDDALDCLKKFSEIPDGVLDPGLGDRLRQGLSSAVERSPLTRRDKNRMKLALREEVDSSDESTIESLPGTASTAPATTTPKPLATGKSPAEWWGHARSLWPTLPLQPRQADFEQTMVSFDKVFASFAPIIKVWLDDRPTGCGRNITSTHVQMALVTQAVNEAYRQQGIDIGRDKQIPMGLDDVLQVAVLRAHAVMSERMPEFSKDIDSANELGRISFQAEKTLQLLFEGFDGTPFECIRPDKRWRMSIDPKKVDALALLGVDVEHNPLLGFMFDGDPSYLLFTTQAWQVCFDRLDQPLSLGLIHELNATCRGKPPQGFDEENSIPTYSAEMGNNMTPAGRPSLIEFGRRMRNTIPLFAVVEKIGDFQKLWVDYQDGKIDSATIRNKLDQMDVSNCETLQVIRPNVPKGTFDELIGDWIERYERAPRGSAQEVLTAIAEFCQDAERAHPYSDANARAFGLLTLNHELWRSGQGLSMPEDLNGFDGLGDAELIKAIEAGRARKAEWEVQAPT